MHSPKPIRDKEADTQALVTNYFNIANTAMAEHKNEFPYNQLRKVGDKVLGGKSIGVGIYKDNPKTPHDFYTYKFQNNGFEFVGRGKKDPDLEFHCSEKYLSKVNADPKKYIDSPAQLDWDWLKSRMSLAS